MTSPDEQAPLLPGNADPQSLAREMFEVHGTAAVSIARENARAAAVAGQRQQAKSWITVLDLIQRHHAKKAGISTVVPSSTI